ncbi:MAG: GAF domain-containing protein [Mediterranea sp.]|jgi:GAF domain-containing protein|nr:GAF domain-containing protein [Mediterranea sp.]
MAENLSINPGGKAEKYRELLPQLRALLDGETDLVANLANLAAALEQTFGFFWVGFYWVKAKGEAFAAARNGSADPPADTEELVLAPFQGPIACTRIRFGRGVCGTAWKEARTLIVPDVERFPGHIACNSASKSEIVVPIFHQNRVIGVLDIDSDRLDDFDEVDKRYLEEACAYLSLAIPDLAVYQ